MLSGILRPESFISTLLQIHHSGKSGELTCEVEEKSFTFSIQQKHIVHARASRMEESFPYFLLVHKVLNQQELAFIANRSRSLRTAEELLFESEIIDADVLYQFQIRYFESLLRVIYQKTGQFSFSLSLHSAEKPVRYPLTDGIVLLLREDQPEEWLASRLGFSAEAALRASEGWQQKAGEYHLDSSESGTLSFLSREASLSQLYAQLPYSRKEVLRHVFLLSSLELIGPAPVVTAAAAPAAKAPAPSGPAGGFSAAETGNLSGAEWEKHLQQRLEWLQEATHYQVLGIGETAGTAEIKQAYYALAKKYHPDLFFGQEFSPKARSCVFDLFEKIRKAHEVLKDPASREKYDQQRRYQQAAPAGTEGGAGSAQEAQGEAESYYQQGTQRIEQADYEGALPFLRYAVTLAPDVPLYRSALARALRHNPRYKKEAEENFLRCIELDPRQADYYVELGLFYKAAGFPKRAENQFRSALQRDPRNRTAQLELKLLAAGEKESGSLFGKILGSKSRKSP